MIPSSGAPSCPLSDGVSKPSLRVGKDAVLPLSPSQCRQLGSLRGLFLRQTVAPAVTGVQIDRSFPLRATSCCQGQSGGGSPEHYFKWGNLI